MAHKIQFNEKLKKFLIDEQIVEDNELVSIILYKHNTDQMFFEGEEVTQKEVAEKFSMSKINALINFFTAFKRIKGLVPEMKFYPKIK